MFRRSQIDRDTSDEIAFHLDARTRDLEQGGLTRDEARRQARAEFGSVLSVSERTREAWGFRRLSELRQDVRHAFRLFARTPVVTLIAILSIAIGVGATSSVFSTADA